MILGPYTLLIFPKAVGTFFAATKIPATVPQHTHTGDTHMRNTETYYMNTTQDLKMFDIFNVGGMAYQVIGFGGDENSYLLDNIDWDDNVDPETGAFLQEPVALDTVWVRDTDIEI
jgi:hypothetical protein